jgi:hypothetical protein
MKMMKHIQTWLLITLLALSANGVVNAKAVSGHQNLSSDLHQSQTVLNTLLHQGLEQVSTMLTSESPLAAKGVDIKVLGRLEDTKVARDWKGHDVLNIKDWTIKKNDQWVQQGIKNKQDFYTASPTKGNLWDKAANRETVFSRELNQIKDAGYIKKGDTYVYPQ